MMDALLGLVKTKHVLTAGAGLCVAVFASSFVRPDTQEDDPFASISAWENAEVTDVAPKAAGEQTSILSPTEPDAIPDSLEPFAAEGLTKPSLDSIAPETSDLADELALEQADSNVIVNDNDWSESGPIENVDQSVLLHGEIEGENQWNESKPIEEADQFVSVEAENDSLLNGDLDGDLDADLEVDDQSLVAPYNPASTRVSGSKSTDQELRDPQVIDEFSKQSPTLVAPPAPTKSAPKKAAKNLVAPGTIEDLNSAEPQSTADEQGSLSDVIITPNQDVFEGELQVAPPASQNSYPSYVDSPMGTVPFGQPIPVLQIPLHQNGDNNGWQPHATPLQTPSNQWVPEVVGQESLSNNYQPFAGGNPAFNNFDGQAIQFPQVPIPTVQLPAQPPIALPQPSLPFQSQSLPPTIVLQQNTPMVFSNRSNQLSPTGVSVIPNPYFGEPTTAVSDLAIPLAIPLTAPSSPNVTIVSVEPEIDNVFQDEIIEYQSEEVDSLQPGIGLVPNQIRAPILRRRNQNSQQALASQSQVAPNSQPILPKRPFSRGRGARSVAGNSLLKFSRTNRGQEPFSDSSPMSLRFTADALFFSRNSADDKAFVVDGNTYEPILRHSDLDPGTDTTGRLTLGFQNQTGTGFEASYFRFDGFTSSQTAYNAIPTFFGESPATASPSYDINYTSRFKNVEINGWKRRSRNFRYGLGFRHVSIDEDFDAVVTGGSFGYFAQTKNELYGGQVMFAFDPQITNNMKLDLGVKLAVFQNDADVGFQSQTRDLAFGDSRTTTLFDFNVGLARKISRTIELRAGYQLMSFNRIAVAPNQSSGYDYFATSADVKFTKATFDGFYFGANIRF